LQNISFRLVVNRISTITTRVRYYAICDRCYETLKKTEWCWHHFLNAKDNTCTLLSKEYRDNLVFYDQIYVTYLKKNV
jgi:hypothetical protein